MDSKKRVQIKIPENTIKFYDYLYNKKITMRYKPEMKLNQLERFQYHPFYEWLVYSNDLDKVISLDESLEKQGIDKGDILEVISSRKPFESFENESNF